MERLKYFYAVSLLLIITMFFVSTLVIRPGHY